MNGFCSLSSEIVEVNHFLNDAKSLHVVQALLFEKCWKNLRPLLMFYYFQLQFKDLGMHFCMT